MGENDPPPLRRSTVNPLSLLLLSNQLRLTVPVAGLTPDSANGPFGMLVGVGVGVGVGGGVGVGVGVGVGETAVASVAAVARFVNDELPTAFTARTR
jgi:friend leukemia integration 1 transcription factor